MSNRFNETELFLGLEHLFPVCPHMLVFMCGFLPLLE